MTITNNQTENTQTGNAVKPMIIGAAVGLAVISIFIFGATHPPAAWGPYWFIRPLVVVPAAGAAGGFFYYLMNGMRNTGGWRMVAANVLSLLVFLLGLWMGTVLGLAGTMWN